MDVLKVEVPVNLQYVEGAKSFKGPKVYTKAEALEYFRNAAAGDRQAVHLSVGGRQQR